MNNDFGMLFERTVKKVFGNPKTQIYFAGYYDTNEYTFKSILLTLCIYQLNYNPENYDDNALEKLKNYESKASKNETDRTEDLEFLKFIGEYEKN